MDHFDATEYTQKIESLRLEREQHLINNPLSWFALIGLFPIQEGENHFSKDPDSRIYIPQLPDSCSAVLRLESGRVYLKDYLGSTITLNGKLPHKDALRCDVDGNPDLIEAGSVALRVIKRGELYFLRVWDRESPDVKNFHGLRYFPINYSYRIQAQFIPFDPPLIVKKLDVIGTEYDQPISGTAKFMVDGKECELIAEEEDDELLFSFIDETRRDATYPGGRFLVASKSKDGSVTLDFNLAVNWPCAYTPFATCPLPPEQNRLPVRVEAGEMRYH